MHACRTSMFEKRYDGCQGSCIPVILTSAVLPKAIQWIQPISLPTLNVPSPAPIPNQPSRSLQVRTRILALANDDQVTYCPLFRHQVILRLACPHKVQVRTRTLSLASDDQVTYCPFPAHQVILRLPFRHEVQVLTRTLALANGDQVAYWPLSLHQVILRLCRTARRARLRGDGESHLDFGRSLEALPAAGRQANCSRKP